jgi:hypothetical protein
VSNSIPRVFEGYSGFCIAALVSGVICIPICGLVPLLTIVAGLALSAIVVSKLEGLGW